MSLRYDNSNIGVWRTLHYLYIQIPTLTDIQAYKHHLPYPITSYSVHSHTLIHTHTTQPHTRTHTAKEENGAGNRACVYIRGRSTHLVSDTQELVSKWHRNDSRNRHNLCFTRVVDHGMATYILRILQHGIHAYFLI